MPIIKKTPPFYIRILYYVHYGLCMAERFVSRWYLELLQRWVDKQ